MLPHTLISTVGTSLLANLENLRKGADQARGDLLQAFDNERWGDVASLLAKLNPADRICGAEINSIQDLLERGKIQSPPFALHFCLSETVKGEVTGRILKAYFEVRGHQARMHSIEGLQDENPGRFRTEGLRNLARCVGEITQGAGGAQFIALNATGGYKAQIAIAVLIGQAIAAPVFYKHELFSEIISFPPMPLSFDYDLLGHHSALLDHLEQGELVELDEAEIDGALRVLLDEVELETGKRLWALAPIGQIYLTGFRQRFPVEKTLPPPAAERHEPTFRDDHYPKGFKEFVHKVWSENEFIISCHSLPYDRQQSIRDREFNVRHDDQIVGEYKSDFGARFAIMTTATTSAQRAAAVAFLNENYGRK